MTDEEPKLQPAQARALEALLEGNTVERAAEAAGVTQRTLYRWFKVPAFKDELRRARHEAISNTLGMAVRAAPLALNTLVKIASDTTLSAQARVTAATNILRFGQESGCIEPFSQRIDDLAATLGQLVTLDPFQIAARGIGHPK